MELPMFGLKSRGARNWLLAAILFGISPLFINLIDSAICLVASGILCDLSIFFAIVTFEFFGLPLAVFMILVLEYSARRKPAGANASVVATPETATLPASPARSNARRNGLILLFGIVALAFISNYGSIRSALTPQADYARLFAAFNLRNASPDGTKRAYIDHGSFEEIPSTLVLVGDIPGMPQFTSRILFTGSEDRVDSLRLIDFYWVDNQNILVRATHYSPEKQRFIKYILVPLTGVAPRILLDRPVLAEDSESVQSRNSAIVFDSDRKQFVDIEESTAPGISTAWLVDITSGISTHLQYRSPLDQGSSVIDTTDPIFITDGSITLLRSKHNFDNNESGNVHNPPLDITVYRSTTAHAGSSTDSMATVDLLGPMLVTPNIWSFQSTATYSLHNNEIVFIDPIIDNRCVAPNSLTFTLYDQSTGAKRTVSAKLDRSIVVTQPNFVFGCKADIELVATDRGIGHVNMLLLRDVGAGELLIADLSQKTITHIGKGSFLDSMYSAKIEG